VSGLRVGSGFDAHRLASGRRLILGGVEIPFERGLAGHSDGDCLTHAVCDALLGAAGLGDLGACFPSDDPRWKDAASLGLLEQVARQVGEAGLVVENVDATVVAESPRLAPYLAEMRGCLSRVLGVDPARVSVKAKTTDGLGATGTGEGIVALAVALLRRKD
jgi:2-C-methyl-D-erythritol 2,4-cyclodiphosphate synthase